MPLNAAGVLLIVAAMLRVMRPKNDGFLSRRKFVRRWTHNAYDIRMEKVMKDYNLEKKGVIPPKASMLPMHPKILQ